MDLKVKITQKEGTNMSSLIKQMCNLKCRIKVNTQEGEISIVGMDDNSFENVIDSIDEVFNIVGIDVLPTAEAPKPVVTEESLEIAKIEFSNEEVENQVNKLMRIIYWAMYSSEATSRDICKYLMAAGAEIEMKYNSREVPKFLVGDVVVCNYGDHLSGEISGERVHAIVCDVDEEGMIYAAPITKVKFDADFQRYLPFEAKVDVDYTVPKYTGGTVLLKKGGYINPERIQYVVGTVRPEFFNKLLAILPKTIQFSHDDYAEKLSEKYGDVDNDDNMLLDDLGEPLNDTKKPSAEDYVATVLASSLESLDKSKPIMEQVDMFLDSIGFKTNNRIIKQAFKVACEVEKIGYENIILELSKVYPKTRTEISKATMREEFKKWLTLYPEAKEQYPKISFMVLLKVFANKMR